MESIESGEWECFGYKFPRQEVVYFTQVIIVYVVIITCLVNLSVGIGESNLWIALLGSSLGYILPQPSMGNGAFLRNTPK